MGGANRRVEADKLVKGVNLVVATPGENYDLFLELSIRVVFILHLLLFSFFRSFIRSFTKYSWIYFS